MKKINWEEDWDFYEDNIEDDNIDIIIYIGRPSEYFTFGKKYKITNRYFNGIKRVTIKNNRGNTDMSEDVMNNQFKIRKLF